MWRPTAGVAIPAFKRQTNSALCVIFRFLDTFLSSGPATDRNATAKDYRIAGAQIHLIIMGKQIPLRTTFHLPDGREVALETGKLATQADGSVLVRMGDTMLLCTIVSAKKAKEGQPFFPLSVDYQEKFAAAGRIPGNFFRREGRLSDYEILISRLVDRALRPLFPDGYMNETQVIITLISADKDVMPDALAGLACSAAVATSDIPV